MKKLVMMAMLLVASATAFAGDSDALKAILKAKTYAEAESLLNSSLSQLASDAEKATAYNKLVDLAYEKFKKEDDTKTTNAVMHKEDPVDIDGMLLAGKQALQAAMECDKYDQLPNEKGKVKIRFRQSNQDRTKGIRLALLQSAVDQINKDQNKEAFENFDLYLQSAKSPFFEGVEGVALNDPNKGIAAFYGGRAAAALEDYKKACEYFKLGVADTAKQVHDLCFESLLYYMRIGQKTAADSAPYISDMKSMLAEFPDNEQIFAGLCDAYIQKGNNAEVLRLSDERQAKYPESALPHIYRAFLLMQDKKYDESIAEFDKVPETAFAYAQCVYNRAICKWNKASDFREANSDMRTGKMPADKQKQFDELLHSAQLDFEKCKELDPEQENIKWGYLLKNIYTISGQQEKADAIL
jgi:hypothetical protein